MTNVFSVVKKQPKYLILLEIMLGLFFAFGGGDLFTSDTEIIDQPKIVDDYQTIPVWVRTTGPFVTDEFENGLGSITWDLGRTTMMHLPSKDGINIIAPEGLEFDTITKIEEPYIQFDQKSYTWIDKIYVTIIDPITDYDPNKIDYIGSAYGTDVKITNKNGESLDYIFIETRKDSGIFNGEIQLTGFEDFDANNDGNKNDASGLTFGHGPYNGMLSTSYNDEVSISYKISPEKIITESVPIEMIEGKVNIYHNSEDPIESFIISVLDWDLNLNSQDADSVIVRLISESDLEGIEVKLHETDFMGMFEGEVKVSSTSSSNTIKAKLGDKLTAIYYDNTLPSPRSFGEVLEITDVSYYEIPKDNVFR